MAHTVNTQDVFPIYLHLMVEAKARLKCLEMITSRQQEMFSDSVAKECCFLQLRMLCELIALACIVAYQNTPTGKLRTLDEPHKIFAELEKLNANFYPQPVIIRDVVVGHGFRMEPINNGSLTKAELLSLRAKAGDKVHRGTIKRFLTTKHPEKEQFKDIVPWLIKIKLLLSEHRIDRGDGKNFLACQLSVPSSAEPNSKYSPYKDGGIRLLKGHKHQ